MVGEEPGGGMLFSTDIGIRERIDDTATAHQERAREILVGNTPFIASIAQIRVETPPEVDHEAAQVLANPDSRQEIDQFARDNDQEGFNQYILNLAAPQQGGMEAVLTGDQARAVIESDYFMRLRQSMDERPDIAEPAIDTDAQEVISQTEVAQQLVEAASRGDRESFERVIHGLGEREIDRPPLLTEAQMDSIINSDLFERLMLSYHRSLSDEISQDYGAAIRNDDQEEAGRLARAVRRNGEQRQQLGERDAVRSSLLDLRNGIKQSYANDGQSRSLGEVVQMHGEAIRETSRAAGYSASDVDEILDMGQFGLSSEDLAGGANKSESEYSKMDTGAVIHQLLIQRMFGEQRGRQETERRRGEKRVAEARLSEEERAQIAASLRRRLEELVGGEQAEEITNAIDSGQIGLGEIGGGSARRHMTTADMDAVPTRNFVNIDGMDFEDRTESRVLLSLRQRTAE
ncbi:MAG: hypothetical protein ABII71_06310 [Candidatus Micrarchaeota archaeon]